MVIAISGQMRIEHNPYVNQYQYRETELIRRGELQDYERQKAERLHKAHLERIRCNEMERAQLTKGRYVDVIA
jgi:hypothetical protein